MVLLLHWPFHQETGSREARQSGKEQKVQLSGEVKASGQRWALSGCGLWLVSPGSLGLNGHHLVQWDHLGQDDHPKSKSHPKYANT